MADSLAKTEIRIAGGTDTEIEAQTENAKAKIATKNLNPKLIKSVMQVPVNIAVARKYLTGIIKK